MEQCATSLAVVGMSAPEQRRRTLQQEKMLNDAQVVLANSIPDGAAEVQDGAARISVLAAAYGLVV